MSPDAICLMSPDAIYPDRIPSDPRRHKDVGNIDEHIPSIDASHYAVELQLPSSSRIRISVLTSDGAGASISSTKLVRP